MTKKVFLICPVRNATSEIKAQLEDYVRQLESQDYDVHYPARDTNQEDPVGVEICRTNAMGIFASDEIHIWFDPESYGSVWDEGGLFMIHILESLHLLGRMRRKVVLIKEVEPTPQKSFANVLLWLVEQTKDF